MRIRISFGRVAPPPLTCEFRGIRFGIGRAFAGHQVRVHDTSTTVQIFDLAGTLIIEHPWPGPGVTYVSNGRPRGRKPRRPSEMS